MFEPATQRLVADLMPPYVFVSEDFGESSDADIAPEEEPAIAAAIPERRREFASGRRCARRALAQLGVHRAAVPSGPSREPVWPPGVVGSITHCDGFRAAAVVSANLSAGIGIDAEPHEPLPRGVRRLMAGAAECVWIERLAADCPETHWDRLLFSAKESVYKVWYPLMGSWLGFEEATVSFDPVSQTFEARLLVPSVRRDNGRPLSACTGRWQVGHGFVATAITLPAAEVA